MTTIRTSMMALAIAAMTILGASGIASAAPHNGAMMNNGYYNNMSPEAQASMQKAYMTINPLEQQLYAKNMELDAQIAAGADDRTIQALVGEVNALSAKLTEAQAQVKRQITKDGIPYNNFMQYCMMMGGSMCGYGGMMGGNYGGGMMHGGGMGQGGMMHGGGMGQGGMMHGGGMMGRCW